MFTKVRQELKGKKHYRIGQRLQVKTATALLTEQRYQNYVNQLKRLTQLPDEHFERFYSSLLQRYVEFVQFIPDDANDALGSMTSNALVRSINILHIFVSQFQEATPLERFALFSACLLQGAERVVTRNKVLIVNKVGSTIKVWRPFTGSLVDDSDANFYKLIPLTSVYYRMEKSVRVTLARQIIGEEAFASLASDMHLLMEWYQVLLEEEEGGLTRMQYAIKRYRQGADNIVDGFILDMELFDSPATEHGDAFLEWLLDGLADGSIATDVPGALVHVTEMGIFLETGIFTIFAERYNPGLVDHFAIQHQFEIMINKEGVATQALSQHNEKSSTFSNPFSKKTGTVHQGVLVFDSAMLTEKPPATDNAVKLPHTLKKSSYQSFAAFNQQQSLTLRNR